MEKKIRKIEIYDILLPLAWAFILVFCVFILSSTAKASGLPYSVDSDEFTFGTYTMSDIETWINNKFINDGAAQYHVDFTNNKTISYTFSGNNITYLRIFTLVDENQKYYFSNYSDSLDNFDTETDSVTLTMSKCHGFILYLANNGNLTWYTWYPNQTQNISLFGQYYIPIYINSNFYNNTFISNVYTESQTIVIGNTYQDFPIGQGHATEPDFPNNIEPGTHILPHQVPTLTINNFTWTTAPTPDFSTLEKTTESIYQYLQWLGSNLTGALNNIVSNIGGIGEYLGQTIQYYCGLIIKNIQDFNKNFYDNMVSLFEPIAENIKGILEKIEEFADLFIHPFDEEEFEEQIENSSFFTNYHAIVDNCDVLDEIIEYAEERDHFSLYISFENPLDNSNHRIISSEISFDWLVPLRSIYRPFLWVCVLIELFVGGARVLTHALGGHGV